MASTETGEMFTDEQYKALTQEKREELKIVGITPEESQHLQGMNRKDRRAWLKANKKFSRRKHQEQVNDLQPLDSDTTSEERRTL